MAFNLLTRKRTARDWSCSIGEVGTDVPQSLKRHPFSIGVISGAIVGTFFGYQIGSAVIENRYGITQSQHLRAKGKK